MTLTNEDLLAISQLLDVKLKAEIQPMKNEIQTLRSEVRDLQTEMHDLQTEVRELKSEMQDLQTEVRELKTEVHQIKLFQETVIMPRLNTIESCYTSTYNRYRDSVDGYEALLADNEIMKKVIMEHTEMLKKLA